MVSRVSVAVVVKDLVERDQKQALASCYSEACLHEAIVKALTSTDGVETLADLAAFFTKKEYEAETTTYRKKIDEVKEMRVQDARLRTAFLIAVAAMETDTADPKKKVEADVEAPLEEDDKKSMLEAWAKRYDMPLSMYMDPADPLVNRLWREYRAVTPSLLPVERVKSTFQYQTPINPRKHQIAHNVAVTFEEQPDQIVSDVVAYYFALQVLANACAKAGNWVLWEDGANVVFAPLGVNMEYAYHALRKATARGGGQRNILDWLREKDLYTRGLMVNYMRGGMSQGGALTKALKDTQVLWANGREGGGPTRSRSPSPRREDAVPRQAAPRGDSGNKVKGKFATKQPSKAGKQYIEQASGGQKFCRLWNQGKCTKEERTCPKSEIHACNYSVGGRPCWNKKHRACNHLQASSSSKY